MSYFRLFVLLGALVVLVGHSSGQDKKDPPPKGKLVLPKYWTQLSLSKEQKDAVHKVNDEFNPKIEEARQKLKDLEAQKSKELGKILTDAQKQKLREIIAGKVPGGDSKPPETKPAPKP